MEILEVVTKLESQNLLKTKRKTGKWMTCYCPFHSNGNEKKPSCGILLEEEYKNHQKYPAGIWNCFSCGYSNDLISGIDDILKLHDIKMSGLEWMQQNISDYKEESEFEFLIPKDIMEATQSKFAVNYIQSLSDTKQKFISEEELSKYRYTVPYMYERHLTDKIIEKFDVGFDPSFQVGHRKVPSITVPVKDENGNTLFIYRRSIEGKFHNYPQDIEKPVFGLDQVPKDCEDLLVCESIINALTAWTYDVPAVALMGTGTSYQMNQLRRSGIRSFTTCFDGDDAGRRATLKFYRNMSDICIVWRINMIDGEDLNSIERSQFFEIYKNRY